jgi:hypothetical protein
MQDIGSLFTELLWQIHRIPEIGSARLARYLLVARDGMQRGQVSRDGEDHQEAEARELGAGVARVGF